MPDKSPAQSTDVKKHERVAKVIARAGLCSRRQAEDWIERGRVSVNGERLLTPARSVSSSDVIHIDGEELPPQTRARLWLFHKPPGVLTSRTDPKNRPVLPDLLPNPLKKLQPVGRLDFNTEGLLLLTNHGGLKRVLELPSTGWLRRYRVRAFGQMDEAALAQARRGVEVDGVRYGPMDIEVERKKGGNAWLTVGLREGKNREVKIVLGTLGLQVNRLIRISYGPFQLSDLPKGEAKEIRTRHLKDQLGPRLLSDADVDLTLPIETAAPAVKRSQLKKSVRPMRHVEQKTTAKTADLAPPRRKKRNR